MIEQAKYLILIMDLIGTAAFAISGAITAIRKNMDIFGVNILALITATGGGVLRDLLIGRTPPVMFRNPVYVIIALVTANIFFVIMWSKRHYSIYVPEKHTHIFNTLLFWFDTLGLAAFTVDGVYAGVYSSDPRNVFLLVVLGILTAVGGGVFRDVLAAEMPYIFRKHIYALASLAGALLTALIGVFAGS
ncbi:MAG: TRIC cation channel family protein [Eubacterium sp.]|nr:TRIC cation channel family protein [Eubacterium sp.]